MTGCHCRLTENLDAAVLVLPIDRVGQHQRIEHTRQREIDDDKGQRGDPLALQAFAGAWLATASSLNTVLSVPQPGVERTMAASRRFFVGFASNTFWQRQTA
ncbi:hypothetical protein A7318_02665 [Pseudomonas lurida]|nr:hypothetical protein A7318_02665 [Pseudomonas lurida]